ncbi:dihydrolipoamide acetyltransferase family protein [Novosphingobium malaysiense]|uniref:dihydrolipoamide acetyltransferase family protein n=1 Tax=Novosphingobium malaysiense TaxID=1348853 RepID=UPI00068B751F|nr:dihydrolipoamide acetyltransferase family protein [Novosphingobium malaysiense]
MAEELIVPKLGMAAAVVTLTAWKAQEGARVEKGDTVLDIEAEKTTFEMPAPISGILHILAPQGVETDVNTVVGLIALNEEEYAALTAGEADDADGPQAPQGALAQDMQAGAETGEEADAGRTFATPIARRLAKEAGLDLGAIAGTGPRGRIQRDDVHKAIERRKLSPALPSPVSAPEGVPTAMYTPVAEKEAGERRVRETIPYAGMRKAIGENMMRSLAINAPNTMSGDYDLTIMAKYRENFVQHESRLGTRITYADLVIHAVAKALAAFPLMNSSLIGSEIRIWGEINIGMAVALGDDGTRGLVVPVIRNADKMTLVEISKATKDLGKRAREGRLGAPEMSGGTFTVTNFGSLGVSSYSTPIINPPESGILGIGRLQKKPIVRGEGILIAPMLPYSLTHDHRVIDGAAAEKFLGVLKDIMENTSADLNELILF